jgi:hypothetical protein
LRLLRYVSGLAGLALEMTGVANVVLLCFILAAPALAVGSHGGLSEIETNLNLLKAADVSADRHAILASIMKLATDAGKAYLAAQGVQPEVATRRSAQQTEGSVVPVIEDGSAMPELSSVSLGRRFLQEGSTVPLGDDSAMPEGSVQAVRRSALGLEEEQETTDASLLREKDAGAHDQIKTVVRHLDKLRRNLAADE